MMLLGAVLSLHLEIADLIAVKDRFRLNGFQTERPVDMPEILHPLCYPVLQAQILSQSIHGSDRLRHRAIPFQPGCHAVIGELGMIADARPIDIRVLQGTVRANHHFNDNGQAILIHVQ